MNYGETLAYWYLRLNGFIPMRNFVLHPSVDATDKNSADSDLLAVRFPHVYEEIGGQPDDWDITWNKWGLQLEKEIIGLIVEVKTSPEIGPGQVSNAFSGMRLQQAIHRMGMFESENVSLLVEGLMQKSFVKEGSYCVGKMLFSHRKGDNLWMNMTFEDTVKFIQKRMKNYSQDKRRARMFFPDELVQYFAWKAGMEQ